MANPGTDAAPKTTVTADGLPEPGAVFARYTLGRRIASGGMAVIFEAVHNELRKPVAIKILAPSIAMNDEARTRFVREGEVAARIRHPHVVDVVDVGIQQGMVFLVMELLSGEDLSKTLRREGRFSVARTADVLVPLCSALQAVHDAGIVHRDVKPENIFMARTPLGDVAPKLVDFGVSKLVEPRDGAQITGFASMLGTPQYMSPEQAAGAGYVDARADQYSVASVAYELVTGSPPHPSGPLLDTLTSIASGRFPRPSELRPDVPPEFEQVILRAMALRPDDRYASVADLARAALPFASAQIRVAWAARLGVEPGSLSPAAFGVRATARTDATPQPAQKTADDKLEETLPEPRPGASEPSPPKTRSRRDPARGGTSLLLGIGAGAVFVLLAGGAAYLLDGAAPHSTAPLPASAPDAASLTTDAQDVAPVIPTPVAVLAAGPDAAAPEADADAVESDADTGPTPVVEGHVPRAHLQPPVPTPARPDAGRVRAPTRPRSGPSRNGAPILH